MTARRIAATVAVPLVLLGAVTLDAPAVSAAADSGASSRVVGRGNILTSIIGWRRVARVPRPGTAAPRCRWVTLRDHEIEFLIALTAAVSGHSGYTAAEMFLDAMGHLLGGDELPDGDLQVQMCGGVAQDMRFTPRTAPPDTVEMLHRQMITHLPAPEPVWSPPPSVPVPLHQPVFASIEPARWAPIESTLTVDGLTAEVRAEPVALRVVTGDPGSLRPVVCAGPGRPFDPGSSVPVREQARHRDACVVTYRTVSGPAWIGTVTVLWDARWRTVGPDGAPGEWRPLGTVARTRLFDRSTRELRTSIESRFTRTSGPTRAGTPGS